MIRVSSRLTEAVDLDYADDVQPGNYVATKRMRLTPGGAWSVTIDEGTLITYDSNGVMKTFNPLTKTWVFRKPPIQGETSFIFHRYGNRGMELKSIWANGTRSLTPAQAKKMLNDLQLQSSVITGSVDEIETALAKIRHGNPNAQLKLEILS